MNKFIPALGALILTVLSLFSAFGFLASGELSSSEALPWLIGYATLFTASLTGMVTCLYKAIRPMA